MSKSTSRVLVFAAQSIVAELTAYRLQLLDLEPVIVSDESELLSQLESCLPSLLIIDLDQSKCDALLTIERWSSDEVTSRIPVLCLSAEGDLGRAERAYMAGAREFVVMPYDPIVLENKVLRLLDSYKNSEASTEPSRAVAV